MKIKMAIFHLHVKNISRGDGRSVVAAAAYRAGETLPNEREERDSAFGGRRDVRHTEILLPAGAPDGFADRATLWNAAEAAERRKDARLAKEIECALPRELPMAAWLEIGRQMAASYVAAGHIVDLAIHEDGRGSNPHLHLLLTTRALTGDGFGGKMRAADGPAFVNEARARWAALLNAALSGAGVEGVDARSHAERGVAAEPGRHRGPDRAERRRNRQQRPRDSRMDTPIDKARKELLADTLALRGFPLLTARPDWPPVERQVPPGMTPDEKAELKLFWRAVDARVVVERPPAEPAPPDREPTILSELKDKAVEALTRPSASARAREAAHKEAHQAQSLEEARAMILELRAENERMRRESAAIRAKYPTMTWDEYDKADRIREANVRPVRPRPDKPDARDGDEVFPVPDPHGRPISPETLARGENAMLYDVEGPAWRYPVTPEPEAWPVEDPARLRAEEEVLRQAEDGPDPETAWAFAERDDPMPPRPQAQPSRDPEVDWLETGNRASQDTHEPERDRHR